MPFLGSTIILLMKILIKVLHNNHPLKPGKCHISPHMLPSFRHESLNLKPSSEREERGCEALSFFTSKINIRRPTVGVLELSKYRSLHIFPPLRVTSDEIQRSYFSSSFIVRNSRIGFKLESRGGGGGGRAWACIYAQLRPIFRSIKPRLFALSQVVATFSLDKTNTFRIVTGGRHLFAR